MSNLVKTNRGLPNSCCQCATPISKEQGWHAVNDEQARAGQGYCDTCANPKPAKQAEGPAPEVKAENQQPPAPEQKAEKGK
jgi:hypothetical protein